MPWSLIFETFIRAIRPMPPKAVQFDRNSNRRPLSMQMTVSIAAGNQFKPDVRHLKPNFLCARMTGKGVSVSGPIKSGSNLEFMAGSPLQNGESSIHQKIHNISSVARYGADCLR
jgi:hypothetical protein